MFVLLNLVVNLFTSESYQSSLMVLEGRRTTRKGVENTMNNGVAPFEAMLWRKIEPKGRAY